ncbi:MAG: hypothetical protein M3316_07225 [Actinomycetota bacterium]|nr:hypothetical protein [Actinomycetota bacterium]
MMEPTDGGTFPELFRLYEITRREITKHQAKALRIITAAYLPLFEVPPCPTLSRWSRTPSAATVLLTDPGTGQLEPANVDAVVSVATSRLDEEDLK